MIELSVLELKKLIDEKKITSVEITKAYLAEIEKKKEYNAVVEVFEDALEQAKAADEKIKNGFKGKLAGIPIIIKDNLLYEGHISASGSRILRDYISQYSATAIKKVLEEGAVILGRSNMDEFGMGSGTENSYFGLTHNPLDFERVPGGSSGGSACAVKLNLCAAALGTDTGGSVRQPSSFCGTVGIKPTYGRVSRFGLVAYASSFDTIGAITKTVADNAYMLDIIAGKDEHDMMTEDEAKEFSSLLGGDVKGMKIGVPEEILEFSKGTDSGKVLAETIEKLKNAGAEIVRVNLKNINLILPTYYILAQAEASTNLNRFDGVKYTMRSSEAKGLEETYKKTRSEGFSKEVKRRIMLGTFVLSSGYHDAYYKKAKAVQNFLKNSFSEMLSKCDAVLIPTTIGEAYKIGSKANPVDAYKEDIYTVPANITGLPAISVPAGKGQTGLPIGMQFLAKKWDEKTLYKVASFIEGK